MIVSRRHKQYCMAGILLVWKKVWEWNIYVLFKYCRQSIELVCYNIAILSIPPLIPARFRGFQPESRNSAEFQEFQRIPARIDRNPTRIDRKSPYLGYICISIPDICCYILILQIFVYLFQSDSQIFPTRVYYEKLQF